MNTSPKINEIQNDSKRIVEEEIFEHLPFQKRMKISSSNVTADFTTIPIIKPSSFDQITKIPGLQHVSEDIFQLLDKTSLMDCRLVNASWKNVLDQPIFWLDKLKSKKIPLDVHKSLKALAKQLDLDQIAKASAKDWLQKFNLEKLSLDIQNKWRGLEEEIDDDNQIPKIFLLVLMKIYQKEEIQSPLKIVVALQKAKKYPALINFILEHEDISSKVNFAFEDDVEWEGITPIHLAACYGLTGTVEKLLVKYDSSNIQTDVNGDTPLICAAFFGHLETVKLLAAFTDISASDNNDQTPILCAAWKGHTNIVKFLAPRVDNPNASGSHGETALFVAAWRGHAQIVEYLSKFTENPNAAGPNGETPLFAAAQEGHAHIVEYLSQFTENPNAPNLYGMTPLYAAAWKGHAQIVEYLSQFTENPNTPNPYGVTPLFIAAVGGHALIVEYLSKFTENPNAPVPNGLTPLEVATSNGHAQIMEFLSTFT